MVERKGSIQAMTTLRAGVIGYGFGGRIFHSPLLEAAGFEVSAIQTSNPERVAAAKKDFPAAKIVASIEELIALKLDLIVVSSQNVGHKSQAIAALRAHIPTVVDKPFAINYADTKEILDIANKEKTPITVFFNRRFDSDTLTIKKAISDGSLGKVFRLEGRFERWAPVTAPDAWREALTKEQGGGKLLDLQPHLLSAVTELFGPAELKFSAVRSIRAFSDDDSVLMVQHASGVDSYLSACEAMGAPGPRIRVTGDKGTLIIQDLDPQEGFIKDGVRPVNGKWEVDTRSKAYLHRGPEVVEYESVPGNYVDFYLQVKACIEGKGEMPVSQSDILMIAKIIDDAYEHSIHKTK